MTDKDYMGSLRDNIDESMKSNDNVKKLVKLLEGISLNIYRQCAKPKGRLGSLVATYAGIRPELCKWGFNLLKPDLNGTFLEIGFGSGYLIYALAKTIKALNASGKVYGIDHSPTMVYDAIEKNEEFIQDGIVKLKCASVYEIPFLNEFFDFCITVNSINFWEDLQLGLSEIYQTLKRGGKFLLLETTFKQDMNPERLIKAKAGGAIIREKELFIEFLKETGFTDCTLYFKEKWLFLAIIAKK